MQQSQWFITRPASCPTIYLAPIVYSRRCGRPEKDGVLRGEARVLRGDTGESDGTVRWWLRHNRQKRTECVTGHATETANQLRHKPTIAIVWATVMGDAAWKPSTVLQGKDPCRFGKRQKRAPWSTTLLGAALQTNAWPRHAKVAFFIFELYWEVFWFKSKRQAQYDYEKKNERKKKEANMLRNALATLGWHGDKLLLSCSKPKLYSALTLRHRHFAKNITFNFLVLN